MKKNGIILLTICLCLGLISGCGSRTQIGEDQMNQAENRSSDVASSAESDIAGADDRSVRVTDDLGREVVLTTKPSRVAALTGSFADTWLLAGGELSAAAHDAWEELHLDLKEDVQDLGSTMKISLETLLASDPDLVIASAKTKSHLDIQATLESAKIPVLYFHVDAFEDYLRMLEVCTQITARPELYEENGLAVETQVRQVREKAEAAVQKQGVQKVLMLRIAASGISVKGSTGTVLGEMLKDLYCENIADGSDLLDELSLEKIIEADPDHIFIVQQGNDSEGAEKALEEALTNNPAWAGLTAVKNGMVHRMDKMLFQFKPDKLWGTAYEQLEELLYEG